MANKTKFGKDAREALLVGMDTVHHAVSVTLGARGRNGAFHRFGRPKITNDGVSIARAIDPIDPFEKMGADFIKEAAEKTNAVAGDGTTTSIVLAHALITEGLKAVNDGANPTILRKEIEESVKKVLDRLTKIAVPVKTHEELARVATISVENPELGKMIADAVKESGDDGKVSVEESSLLTTEVEMLEGYNFNKGFISPYMVTDPSKMKTELTNCRILVTDKSFNLVKDLIPMMEGMGSRDERNLLIIAEDVSDKALELLVVNHLKGGFHGVAVKRPHDKDCLEDIAAFTGATVFSKEKGMVTFRSELLGWADKVIVDECSTSIIGGHGEAESNREALRTQIASAEDYEKTKLEDRLSMLNGKSAIIKIGAATEAEMKQIKDKVDDAVAATKCAKDGIIPGGGVTLARVAHHILRDSGSIAESIVRTACSAPHKQILENAGITEEKHFTISVDSKSGINALTLEEVPDMLEAGIIDPVKVTKTALQNAVSLAAVFLTLESATVEIENETGNR